MMTIGEQRDVAIRNECLRAIATELKRANRLKALELKARSQELGITPETSVELERMVDDIMASKEGE